MYKVYSIHNNKESSFTDNFFVKINRVITWLKSDVKLNSRPYFSADKMQAIMQESAFALQFNALKEGQSLDVKYGSCSNHYRIVKMTVKEIADLHEIHAKKIELEKIKKEIEKNIPLELTKKMQSINKELKVLNSQTM